MGYIDTSDLISQFVGKLSKKIIQILLFDRTTRRNIIWATTEYESYGTDFNEYQEITWSVICGLHGDIIQPRIIKSNELQRKRTQLRAEVFTPSWVCNLQNNIIDNEWFGEKNVFNIAKDKTWITNKGIIKFPKNKSWKQYVDSKRLEITCGEAPYLASPYDTTTGVSIEVSERIGLLDRKLRVVNENTHDEREWLKWVIRAYQSVYGYEFQGDNLLIARINLLHTFMDNLKYRWKREASFEELSGIARVISWNIWQMDAMTGTVPFGKSERYELTNLFEQKNEERMPLQCRIMDWRSKTSVEFNSIRMKN